MPLGGPATGRLAPTPSGRLHLGNTLSFGLAWLSARSAGGRLLLRIEDVDIGRARPEIEVSIREDLLWLGRVWDEETAQQEAPLGIIDEDIRARYAGSHATRILAPLPKESRPEPDAVELRERQE